MSSRQPVPPSPLDPLIDAFGGLSKMARTLGHRHVTTIDGWRRAGRIPRWRLPEVMAGAERMGISLSLLPSDRRVRAR